MKNKVSHKAKINAKYSGVLRVALESVTFGKRVTRWSNLEDSFLNIENDKEMYDSVIKYLLRASRYKPTTGEELLLLVKV